MVNLKLVFTLNGKAAVGTDLPVRLDGVPLGMLRVTKCTLVAAGLYKIHGEMSTAEADVPKLINYIDKGV